MKKQRVLRIIGMIDEGAFKTFSEELLELENAGTGDIVVELNSGGGVTYDALAFAARIRNSPCDIIIRAYGYIASAAVIILAVGDTRQMAMESWVMVHEDSAKVKGSVVDLERDVNHLRRMEVQWCDLLSRHTTTPAEKWSFFHKNTTYLSAKECFKLGLVDELV